MTRESIAGAILGCAVGDALGLPYENLTARRGPRLLGPPDRHRFFFGRGMVSDDTQHTCMVAQSLCEHPDDIDAFARAFSRRLRWWLLGIPAGIGFATLRACLKLWLGFSPKTSGVRSLGNGAGMRAAVIGAAIDDLDAMLAHVQAASAVTHRDPRSVDSAAAIALAAWCGTRQRNLLSAYPSLCSHYLSRTEWMPRIEQIVSSVQAGHSTREFAESIGCKQGVSGYIFHSVPVALHASLSTPDDFSHAVKAVIECGGDTDTTAAMAGGIVGARVGVKGIPEAWIAGLGEWPKSAAWMQVLAEVLGDAMSTRQSRRAPRASAVLEMARNAVFLTTVLTHVGRRALPPY